MFHNFYKKIELLQRNNSVRLVEKDRVNPDVNVGIETNFSSILIKQERSDSPQEPVLEPDLNIVKCEDTELLEVYEVQVNESDNYDNSCDPSRYFLLKILYGFFHLKSILSFTLRFSFIIRQ